MVDRGRRGEEEEEEEDEESLEDIILYNDEDFQNAQKKNWTHL